MLPPTLTLTTFITCPYDVVLKDHTLCYLFIVDVNIAGALSVTDNDDDYCISYTVTVVDVRSCTRPSRLLDHTKYPGMFHSSYTL